MENEPLIDEPLKRELSALYRAESRHYHSLAHIEAMLTLAGQYRASLHDPEAVEAAIWFHDAIYDSRAKDNEAKSAALAEKKLAGRTDAERLSRVAAMIIATATHELPHFDDDNAVRDAALFLDMDLAILGAAPDAFDAYEQAVRREYGWVEEPMWRAGRSAVLRSFLARPHIFHTEEFRHRLEPQARQNVARSIEALEA
ncbi:putative metal-dependent HD superfamily phosphohydrolase [Mesorhizobium robiniae]|uniref:Metal-dependent HD superfamily phosphohydrolase n=1 Tax=Mesorhizobium robiniae TaxID=559315 RepID=A0ABV2GR98_9HYPH